MVVVNAVVHTSVSVTGRYYNLKGIPSFDLTLDGYFWHAITLLIANMIYVAVGGYIDFKLMINIGLGSLFNLTGFFLCTEACVHGKAGPAQALMEM